MSEIIKKLRNKIWLFLLIFFLPILAFALLVIYLSNQTFRFQQLQNTFNSIHENEVQRILETESDNQRILIEIEWEEEPKILIHSSLPITEAESLEIINKAFDQTFSNRMRNRFIWQIPFPIIDFQGMNWFFTTSGETSLTNPRYILFTNVSAEINQITEFQWTLFKIGAICLLTFVFIAYYFANFLVKPSAQAFERQKQFIADASHELKTPIAIIKSNYNTLMLEENEFTPNQQKWLNNMEFGLDRMTNLTRDLLILAQLDQPQDILKKQDFNLSETVTTALQSFVTYIFEKDIDMIIEIESGIIINQNQEKMMQVVMILLDNAIKYVNEGGWIEVSLTEIKQHSHVKFSIKNSGPGIPETKLSHIFERFYRVDESRNNESKSYGLGLAIAKEITNQIGGKIRVTSIENEMTEFNLIIKK